MTTPFDTALPFAAGAFDVAVAVNVLDHLPEPAMAIAEANRVLAAAGTLIAAAASRHDSPELAAVWRPPPPSFDAEDGPGLVARFVAPEATATAAEQVATPIAITKRGAVIHARK